MSMFITFRPEARGRREDIRGVGEEVVFRRGKGED